MLKLDITDTTEAIIVEQYEKVFQHILELFITDQEVDAPCMRLYHPKTRTTWMILWLLSLEPGFYSELNLAIEQMHEQAIDTFGPISRGLHDITEHGEEHREDAILANIDKVLMEQELGIF